jgi:hypothetical protein
MGVEPMIRYQLAENVRAKQIQRAPATASQLTKKERNQAKATRQDCNEKQEKKKLMMSI